MQNSAKRCTAHTCDRMAAIAAQPCRTARVARVYRNRIVGWSRCRYDPLQLSRASKISIFKYKSLRHKVAIEIKPHRLRISFRFDLWGHTLYGLSAGGDNGCRFGVRDSWARFELSNVDLAAVRNIGRLYTLLLLDHRRCRATVRITEHVRIIGWRLYRKSVEDVVVQLIFACIWLLTRFTDLWCTAHIISLPFPFSFSFFLPKEKFRRKCLNSTFQKLKLVTCRF